MIEARAPSGTLVLVVAALLAAASPCAADTAFPGNMPPVDLSGGLAGCSGSFEPSGAVWQPFLQSLVVVSDNGKIARFDAAGNLQDCVSLSGSPDLEAVCYAAEDSPLIYVGVEHPDSIFAYDPLNPCSGPGNCPTFSLTGILQSGANNAGLEGLTFVPVAGHPEGGLFIAGLQENGRLYVIDVPVISGGSAELVDILVPTSALTDVKGLHYDREFGRLFAIYDNADRMVELRTDGETVACYDLLGTQQEGIAIHACDIVIADDVDGSILRYPGLPAPTDDPDADADGVTDCTDDCPATMTGETVGANGCACGQDPPGLCGNRMCEPAGGEDCENCPTDCNGILTGDPENRYCCGGTGEYAVDCVDFRCSLSGRSCGVPSCCDDGMCGVTENSCSCELDCGAPDAVETPGLTCHNGQDDDCDGLVDCLDPDCCSGFPPCGSDSDSDGFTACDCNDADGSAWAQPSPVMLSWSSRDDLDWTTPANLGGLSVVYDVLRADSPFGFLDATCIESDDGTDAAAFDDDPISVSAVRYYLVRADNGCTTAGSLGADSSGDRRFGRLCEP